MPAKRPEKPVLDEVATVEKDIDIFSGYMTRLENPDSVLRLESRGRGVRLYEELERDWQVFLCKQKRELNLIGCEWQVEPATQKRQDVKVADYVEKALKSTNFDGLCRDLAQAVLCGYKPAEVMWEYSEGDVWVREFRARRPSRFIFDTQYKMRQITPYNQVDGEPVPDKKFITWSWGGSEHNPYGRGLGYQCYWPVWFKKHGVKFWMQFLEDFAAPTPVGKYPPGAKKEEKDTLLEALSAIRQRTGIRIPDTMLIDLLEATRSGVGTYPEACDYFDRAIAKVWLGGTLTTDSGNTGSYSLGQVHQSGEQAILKADADEQCELLNMTLVRWIVDYNFPDTLRSGYPRVWRRTEPEADLKPLAERDKILLVDMGMGRRVPETYLSDAYGLPLAKEGEKTISESSEETKSSEEREVRSEETTDFSASPSSLLTSHSSLSFGQEGVDRLGDEAIARAETEMEAILAPVLAFIDGAQSLEEIAEGIYRLYPQMDSRTFQELLTRAMSAAALTGYAASSQEEDSE